MPYACGVEFRNDPNCPTKSADRPLTTACGSARDLRTACVRAISARMERLKTSSSSCKAALPPGRANPTPLTMLGILPASMAFGSSYWAASVASDEPSRTTVTQPLSRGSTEYLRDDVGRQDALRVHALNRVATVGQTRQIPDVRGTLLCGLLRALGVADRLLHGRGVLVDGRLPYRAPWRGLGRVGLAAQQINLRLEGGDLGFVLVAQRGGVLRDESLDDLRDVVLLAGSLRGGQRGRRLRHVGRAHRSVQHRAGRSHWAGVRVGVRDVVVQAGQGVAGGVLGACAVEPACRAAAGDVGGVVARLARRRRALLAGGERTPGE